MPERDRPEKTPLIQKYELACLVGADTFFFVKINMGGDSPNFDRSFRRLDIGSRVLKVVNDKQYTMGMLMLTDQGERI